MARRLSLSFPGKKNRGEESIPLLNETTSTSDDEEAPIPKKHVRFAALPYDEKDKFRPAKHLGGHEIAAARRKKFLSLRKVTPPRDYASLAWLSCLFCFPPVGVVALFYSRKVRKAMADGDMLEAERNSRLTRNYIAVALLVGFIVVFSALFAQHWKTSGRPPPTRLE